MTPIDNMAVKAYFEMIWRSSNIRNRIQNAISSTNDSTEQINNILDIIEDSSVNSDSEAVITLVPISSRSATFLMSFSS